MKIIPKQGCTAEFSLARRKSVVDKKQNILAMLNFVEVTTGQEGIFRTIKRIQSIAATLTCFYIPHSAVKICKNRLKLQQWIVFF